MAKKMPVLLLVTSKYERRKKNNLAVLLVSSNVLIANKKVQISFTLCTFTLSRAVKMPILLLVTSKYECSNK